MALGLMLAGCPERDARREASTAEIDSGRPARLAPPASQSTTPAVRALDDEMQRLDPVSDGFESEQLSAKADEILSELGKLLGTPVSAADLGPVVAETFVGSQLRPDELEVVFRNQDLEILAGHLTASHHHGREGLARALEELARPFAGGEVKVKFKIDRLELTGEAEAVTSIIYLGMGRGESGPIQQNARWTARWSVAGGFDAPVLLAVEASGYRENRVRAPLYSDVTESLFRDSPGAERIRRGIDSWWGRIDAGLGFSFYGDYALVLGDVDNDGLDDVYLCQPGGVPNQLFRHNPDGTLTDISQSSSTDLLNDTPTALFADFDNDGNQDLVVANLLYLTLMRGDGSGGFALASETQVDNAVSISAADFDNDGALDLYVTRYSSSRSTPSGAAVYDSNEGRPNVLLRNEGGLRFRDVTLESGIDDNNRKFSFAGVWEDYDNDGDQDLYVANDFGRNNLYRNNADGTFNDVAGAAGAEDSAAGMGATWADYDGDGLMDLYVSNMFSSAGGRIVDQPRISSIAGGDAVEPLRRFAKGNTLLRNLGDGSFEDVSVEAGVTMGRWSWGGQFVDCNNDGWQDLMVPNGFISNHDSKDL
jgi:hypothetical protein